jgi:hypothetical protein
MTGVSQRWDLLHPMADRPHRSDATTELSGISSAPKPVHSPPMAQLERLWLFTAGFRDITSRVERFAYEDPADDDPNCR